MANKEIVIDVVSEYSDHASSGLQQTGKNAEKASREMDKLGKKRAKPKLGLEDKASPVLDKFGKKGDGLGKKTWTPKLGLKDTLCQFIISMPPLTQFFIMQSEIEISV